MDAGHDSFDEDDFDDPLADLTDEERKELARESAYWIQLAEGENLGEDGYPIDDEDELYEVYSPPSWVKRKRELSEKNSSLQELKSMPYEDYLLTPYWLKAAEEMRKLAQYKCQNCGKSQPKTRKLHVHHKHYRSRGEEKLEDVEVLCTKCHKEKHPDWR